MAEHLLEIVEVLRVVDFVPFDTISLTGLRWVEAALVTGAEGDRRGQKRAPQLEEEKQHARSSEKPSTSSWLRCSFLSYAGWGLLHMKCGLEREKGEKKRCHEHTHATSSEAKDRITCINCIRYPAFYTAVLQRSHIKSAVHRVWKNNRHGIWATGAAN